MNTYSFNYGGLKATGATAEGGVAGSKLSTTPFQFGDTTGRFKIIGENINGVPCKTVQATTAGRLSLDLTALTGGAGNLTGFGEWTFWVYKNTDANTLIINYISKDNATYNTTGNQTYSIAFDSVERLHCFRGNGASAATSQAIQAVSALVIQTWYRIRVTRDVLGVFTFYILGGTFTTETVFSATSGANPTAADRTYLLGNWFTIDFGLNDKIILASADGTMGLSHKMIA